MRRGWGGMPVARFLKYRKARLIRMAKLGCGALASGFIVTPTNSGANKAEPMRAEQALTGYGTFGELRVVHTAAIDD